MLRDILIQKGLSQREAEVAELVTKGLSNKEVASRLFVTEKTVKFHLTNIYKKMNLRSRAQLIVWCLPHLNFAEMNQDGDMANALNSNKASSAPTASNMATLASKNSLFGTQSSDELPTILPGAQNIVLNETVSNSNENREGETQSEAS